MNRAILLSACVLAAPLACTDSPRAPTPPTGVSSGGDAGARAPREHRASPIGIEEDAGALKEAGTVDAGLSDAGPVDAGSVDGGLANAGLVDAGPLTERGTTCSAQGLNPTPAAATPPLPPAVESMRRRIVVAAVACDYAALGVLADEKGKSVRFSFGPGDDAATFWREQEQKYGDPVLARMVKVLSLPYTQQHGLYVWPSAFRENPTAQDFEALKGLYPDDQLEAMRKDKSYLGLRIGISGTGDWQLAVAGD